jgi:AGCS family alanine or glycine:cation symporter
LHAQSLKAKNLFKIALFFKQPLFDPFAIYVIAFFFAITSLFSYSYYGSKALAFLIGVKASRYYDYFYLFTVIIGAVASMTDVMNVIDI